MPTYSLLELGDGARSERPRQQPAEPAVLRWIHVEHHPAHVAKRLGRRRVSDLGATDGRREQLRLGQDRLDIQPEARPTGPAEHRPLLDPDDRAGAPQSSQSVERDALDVVDGSNTTSVSVLGIAAPLRESSSSRAIVGDIRVLLRWYNTDGASAVAARSCQSAWAWSNGSGVLAG